MNDQHQLMKHQIIKNDKGNGHEIIFIDKESFYCDGGEFGHPRVYYTVKNGEAICGYCNIKYVYKEGKN